MVIRYIPRTVTLSSAYGRGILMDLSIARNTEVKTTRPGQGIKKKKKERVKNKEKERDRERKRDR